MVTALCLPGIVSPGAFTSTYTYASAEPQAIAWVFETRFLKVTLGPSGGGLFRKTPMVIGRFEGEMMLLNTDEGKRRASGRLWRQSLSSHLRKRLAKGRRPRVSTARKAVGVGGRKTLCLGARHSFARRPTLAALLLNDALLTPICAAMSP